MTETHVVRVEDMPALAERVVTLLSHVDKKGAKVILLQGEMGAGKTTFTKELGEILGVEKDDIHSPTFILKKEYLTQNPIHKKLIHVDAYRFNHPSEAKVLRLSEDLETDGNLLSIEWPDKMQYVKGDIELVFNLIDDDTREVVLTFEKDI
ncbi:MAG: ATPase, YjeE family [Candidatus Nomurabacteria bacterium]|nr:ATPase, YjeE family [Candidatus Nomurabacteria bacterium]